jgi:hypothetical protein
LEQRELLRKRHEQIQAAQSDVSRTC